MKNNFVKFIVFSSILISSFSTFAQKDVKGKVTDFLTYATIESASVYIQNTTIGTVTNSNGKFSLYVPQENMNDTLVVSSIGYKSFKTSISEYTNPTDIFLEEELASLDEVVIKTDTRPKTGNDIVLRALDRLPRTLPDQPYLEKGFLRHKERNKKEYKWLIESAITFYDEGYDSLAKNKLKINVDENRKSYDLRDVDSLFAYTSYLKYKTNAKLKSKSIRRDTIKTSNLVKAIKWNDQRVNGLDNLFNGNLNLVRNANLKKALFGDKMLDDHQFTLDTILVDNGRKLYKIKIEKGKDFVNLNTPNIFNDGFEPKGFIYIYYDNYAIKKIEYQLVAASETQKKRSKSLFDTYLNHKLILNYKDYDGKMYLNYMYYETPKLVNAGDRSTDKTKDEDELEKMKNEQFYYTTQEILFSDIILDPTEIAAEKPTNWDDDIFAPRNYNAEFWKNYNVLLESEEEQKLILDLTKRATLFKQ